MYQRDKGCVWSGSPFLSPFQAAPPQLCFLRIPLGKRGGGIKYNKEGGGGGGDKRPPVLESSPFVFSPPVGQDGRHANRHQEACLVLLPLQILLLLLPVLVRAAITLLVRFASLQAWETRGDFPMERASSTGTAAAVTRKATPMATRLRWRRQCGKGSSETIHMYCSGINSSSSSSNSIFLPQAGLTTLPRRE